MAIIGSQQYQSNEFPRPQTPSRINRSLNEFSYNPYNPFMNQNQDRNINQSDRNIEESNHSSLPTESQLYASGTIPAPSPNYLKQNMEQINLLRMILNSINNNINQGIISKILILICFLVYYGYFAIQFLYGDGYRYRALRNLFYMSLGLFVMIVGGLSQNIYKSKSKS